MKLLGNKWRVLGVQKLACSKLFFFTFNFIHLCFEYNGNRVQNSFQSVFPSLSVFSPLLLSMAYVSFQRCFALIQGMHVYMYV